MNAAEKKAHAKAVKIFEETWLKYHGFPPRTFNYDEMTTEEIEQLTAEEIDENTP